MNSEEQTLIDGLFGKLEQAQANSATRDPQAEARIKEHLTKNPAIPYYMTQTILIQEAALKRIDQQNKELQAEIQHLRETQAQPQPAASSGGFLSGLFGGGSSAPRPSAPPSSSGGWREPGPTSQPQPYPSQPQQYAQPPQQPMYAQPPQQPAYAQPAAPGAFGGFMGGALKTAAGVAGGVMLAEGISSMFHHNAQPQEIVEVIDERGGNNGGNVNEWGNNEHDRGNFDQDRFAGGNNDGFATNDNFGNNDNFGGNNDTFGSDDGGGFFNDDDDSFV